MHVIQFTPEQREALNAKLETIKEMEEAELEEMGSCVSQEANYAHFVDMRFKEFPDMPSTLHHAATGCRGEAGELIDCSKKLWAHNKPLDVTNLIEELGDLMFYMQKIMNMLDISIEDVRRTNVHKLMKRYPSGKYTDAQCHERADKKE